MKTIECKKLVVKMPENWDEVNLSQFVEFIKWSSKKPETFEMEIDALLYNMRLISVFSVNPITQRELESLSLLEMKNIVDELQSLVLTTPNYEKKDHFIFNNVLYSFIDFNNMSVGEYVSYRQVLEAKTETIDVLPELLAIICRPAKKELNVETGKDHFIIDEFNSDDIKYRSELFRQIPAFLVMATADFFFNGNQTLIKDLNALKKGKKTQASLNQK